MLAGRRLGAEASSAAPVAARSAASSASAAANMVHTHNVGSRALPLQGADQATVVSEVGCWWPPPRPVSAAAPVRRDLRVGRPRRTVPTGAVPPSAPDDHPESGSSEEQVAFQTAAVLGGAEVGELPWVVLSDPPGPVLLGHSDRKLDVGFF